MIIFLKLWRELLILVFVIACLLLINSNQDKKYKIKEIQFIHEKQLKESELNFVKDMFEFSEKRRLDVEEYAKKVNDLNDKYAVAMSDSNRVQQSITDYNNRISSNTRQALENYAKTSSVLYSECRKEYLNLGYYTAKVDAELDSKTKAP